MSGRRTAFWVVGLLCLGGVTTAAQEPADAEQRVRRAIQTMTDHPLSQESVIAQGEVVGFAKTSDRVAVAISPELFLFAGSPYDSILLSHYIAGAVLYDLDHPKQAKKAYADVPAALGSALAAYRWLKRAKVPYDNAFFEGLDAGDARGEFDKLAKDLISRARMNPQQLIPIAK